MNVLFMAKNNDYLTHLISKIRVETGLQCMDLQADIDLRPGQ